jgi:hypothetical protein
VCGRSRFTIVLGHATLHKLLEEVSCAGSSTLMTSDLFHVDQATNLGSTSRHVGLSLFHFLSFFYLVFKVFCCLFELSSDSSNFGVVLLNSNVLRSYLFVAVSHLYLHGRNALVLGYHLAELLFQSEFNLFQVSLLLFDLDDLHVLLFVVVFQLLNCFLRLFNFLHFLLRFVCE